MRKIKNIFKFILFSWLVPLYVFAQQYPTPDFRTETIGYQGGNTFRNFIGGVLSVITLIFPLLYTLAFIVFFWGVSRFILNSGNAVDRQNGKKFMFWGIIALFVLISFRAIIGFAVGEFGFDVDTISGVLLPQQD